MELWRDRLAGALVAIGNAPTALFRLLEMLDEGAPSPAAVIGMPVGFVGAAESKEALIADGRLPYLVVRGRRGGSAHGGSGHQRARERKRMSGSPTCRKRPRPASWRRARPGRSRARHAQGGPPHRRSAGRGLFRQEGPAIECAPHRLLLDQAGRHRARARLPGDDRDPLRSAGLCVRASPLLRRGGARNRGASLGRARRRAHLRRRPVLLRLLHAYPGAAEGSLRHLDLRRHHRHVRMLDGRAGADELGR